MYKCLTCVTHINPLEGTSGPGECMICIVDEIHVDANETRSQRPERLLIFNVAQHSLRSCWCCRTVVSINCLHTHRMRLQLSVTVSWTHIKLTSALQSCHISPPHTAQTRASFSTRGWLELFGFADNLIQFPVLVLWSWTPVIPLLHWFSDTNASENNCL